MKIYIVVQVRSTGLAFLRKCPVERNCIMKVLYNKERETERAVENEG